MIRKVGVGVASAFLLLCLCGGIANACDDDQPATPARVVDTSAPITSTSVTAAAKLTTAKPSPKPTTAKPKPKPTTKPPSTDPRYGTCAEANDHGYGPYYEGEDPEYDWYRDRDGDGIVCER